MSSQHLIRLPGDLQCDGLVQRRLDVVDLDVDARDLDVDAREGLTCVGHLAFEQCDLQLVGWRRARDPACGLSSVDDGSLDLHRGHHELRPLHLEVDDATLEIEVGLDTNIHDFKHSYHSFSLSFEQVSSRVLIVSTILKGYEP